MSHLGINPAVKFVWEGVVGYLIGLLFTTCVVLETDATMHWQMKDGIQTKDGKHCHSTIAVWWVRWRESDRKPSRQTWKQTYRKPDSMGWSQTYSFSNL